MRYLVSLLNVFIGILYTALWHTQDKVYVRLVVTLILSM